VTASLEALHDVVPVSMIDGGLTAVSFGGSKLDCRAGDLSVLNFAASYAVGSCLHHTESLQHYHHKSYAARIRLLALGWRGKDRLGNLRHPWNFALDSIEAYRRRS
jgi:hypothetical protein